MTDDDLLDALNDLGIAAEDHRLVALLPLVQVAWADGAIQHRERMQICESARDFGIHRPEALARLEGWLSTAPTETFFDRGRQVLMALATRHRGLGADLPDDTVDRVEALCLDVAKAAGGLFDRAFTVSAEEREALAKITAQLAVHRWSAEQLLPGDGTYIDL